MKFFLFVVIGLISLKTYSQDTIRKVFFPIEHYKNSGEKLTKQDSLKFKFHNGDTLVEVSEAYITAQNSSENGKVRVPYEPKDSLFLEIYKNVVYNNQKENTRKEFMRYWKDSVKIYFEPSVPDFQARELMNFASHISSDIDSLNIVRVANPEESNFKVYFLNAENNTDFEPRINGNGYYINWNEKSQITSGFLKVNSARVKSKKHQLSLLKFHFLKSLGHFKNSETLDCKSYLSACNTPREITKMDLDLLKYHYSYGICKGVGLQTFENLHSQMQAKLKEEPNAKLFLIHSE